MKVQIIETIKSEDVHSLAVQKFLSAVEKPQIVGYHVRLDYSDRIYSTMILFEKYKP